MLNGKHQPWSYLGTCCAMHLVLLQVRKLEASAQRHLHVSISFFYEIKTSTWRIPEKQPFSPTQMSTGCIRCGHECGSHNDPGRSAPVSSLGLRPEGHHYSGNGLVTMAAGSQGKPITNSFQNLFLSSLQHHISGIEFNSMSQSHRTRKHMQPSAKGASRDKVKVCTCRELQGTR